MTLAIDLSIEIELLGQVNGYAPLIQKKKEKNLFIKVKNNEKRSQFNIFLLYRSK